MPRAKHSDTRSASMRYAKNDGGFWRGADGASGILPLGLDGKIPGDVSGESVLGYWLGQPYWGNGYGREAVACLDTVCISNARSEGRQCLYRPRQCSITKNLAALRTGRSRTRQFHAQRCPPCSSIPNPGWHATKFLDTVEKLALLTMDGNT
jgi:hypothetical protein